MWSVMGEVFSRTGSLLFIWKVKVDDIFSGTLRMAPVCFEMVISAVLLITSSKVLRRQFTISPPPNPDKVLVISPPFLHLQLSPLLTLGSRALRQRISRALEMTELPLFRRFEIGHLCIFILPVVDAPALILSLQHTSCQHKDSMTSQE